MESVQNNAPIAGEPSWTQRIILGKNPRVTLVRIVVLIIACFLAFHYVLLPIRVSGISMQPTYRDGGVNVVNRLAYRSREPQRGDVVAIRAGAGSSILLMKRVIGLPGESIAFHEGQAVINGEVLNEPYLKFKCNWEREPRVNGPDEYYCVGDNRSMPEADHVEGRFKRERIIGRVIL